MKTTKTPRAAVTAHTPGPWRVQGDGVHGPQMPWPLEPSQKRGEVPVRVDAEVVAIVRAGGCGASYRHYPFAVADANRQLIAAAPLLLACLEKAAIPGGLSEFDFKAWLPIARAAIAQARGN